LLPRFSAIFVWFDLTTPFLLLLFTFLVGAGAALMAPPWQAVVPQLVPKHDLAAAVAANSIGFNVCRAVGPARGGATIATHVASYPAWQAWLREHKPPTLVIWGDGTIPRSLLLEAFKRDLPNAEIHLLDAGHFALDEKNDEIARLILTFLARHSN
jgi:pimeloyl-ACP methyl ester carboxylesterase